MDVRYNGFNVKKNFYEMGKLCRKMGRKFAVVRDQQSLKRISREFHETCLQEKDGKKLEWFYSGYTDEEKDEQWVDVEGGPMRWTNWFPGYPHNYPKYDCAVYRSEQSLEAGIPHMQWNGVCSELTCPVCELKSQSPNFILRGVCLNSSVDSFFYSKSPTEFLGYIQTQMIFSWDEMRWEIVNNSDARTLLAYMEFEKDNNPLGVHRWRILDAECTDPDDEFYRSLNFHLEVAQPGHFCCDDGTCVDSQTVCNGYADCEDGSDERNCTLLTVEKFKNQGIDLNGTLNVLKIFEINEVDSTFDLYFSLEIEWYQHGVYQFLKQKDYDNTLVLSESPGMFIPKVEFGYIRKVIQQSEEFITVIRRAKPVMENDLDNIIAREVYTGKENPLKIIFQRRYKFSCSFNKIEMYPFGIQECFVDLRLVGPTYQSPRLQIHHVTTEEEQVVGQYKVEKWIIDNDMDDQQTGRKMVRVTMILTRNRYVIFAVTYLPTVFMNMINQATNYISGEDKYSMIYTINITCMMVLASIFISVSSSLPITTKIKPVELWLIFNLAYPFVTILANVLLQVVTHRTIRHSNDN